MIVYEVNLAVDWALADEYRRWLEQHVGEMLALPGFLSAERFDVLSAPGEDAQARFCVQYRLRDAAALDAYLAEHAARMRADGVARFGERFSATRRLLQPVTTGRGVAETD